MRMTSLFMQTSSAEGSGEDSKNNERKKTYNFTRNKNWRSQERSLKSCLRLKLCFVVYVSPLRDGFVLLNDDIEKKQKLHARAKKGWNFLVRSLREQTFMISLTLITASITGFRTWRLRSLPCLINAIEACPQNFFSRELSAPL